jgi:hypothetical protein
MQPPFGGENTHDRGCRARTTTACCHLAHDMRRLLACWMTSKYLLETNDALGSSSAAGIADRPPTTRPAVRKAPAQSHNGTP